MRKLASVAHPFGLSITPPLIYTTVALVVLVREEAIHRAGGTILCCDGMDIGPTFVFFAVRTAIIERGRGLEDGKSQRGRAVGGAVFWWSGRQGMEFELVDVLFTGRSWMSSEGGVFQPWVFIAAFVAIIVVQEGERVGWLPLWSARHGREQSVVNVLFTGKM